MSFWFVLGGLRLLVHGIFPNFDSKCGYSTVQKYKGKPIDD